MSPRAAPAFVIALLSSFAGCTQSTPEPPPGPSPSEFQFIDPMFDGTGHDHRLASQHVGSLNMTLLGAHHLVREDSKSPTAHGIDVRGDIVMVGVAGAEGQGFDLLDVSDEANPKKVGAFRDPSATGGDRNVALSPDGQFAFMANEPPQTAPITNAGIKVVDVRDPTKPTLASHYVITPNGAHTVFSHAFAGEVYVFALNYGVHILRLETEPAPARLVPVGRYFVADPDALQAVNANGADTVATRRAVYGHDMAVYTEASGRTIMYVAYAYAGLRIVDITNPSAPTELGHWIPPGSPRLHYTHSVQTYQKADGRRITVLGSETFEEWHTNTPSPLWVLDTTDLSAPKHLSTWSNPGGHGADHLLFSLHFYRVANDTIYLAHYHGGFWALNISDPANPTVAGYHLPAIDYGYAPGDVQSPGSPFKTGGVPLTWDVAMHGTSAVVSDMASGVYILRLNATR